MSGRGEAAGRRVLSGRPWFVVLGVVIGAVAMAGALAAVLNEGGSDGESASDGGGADGDVVPRAETEWEYEWPASYAGPVWITVEAPDEAARTITIRWGPWERRIVHESAEPVSYAFTKNPGETVPTTVTVEPGAEVVFDAGTPPSGAVDVNDGWTPAADVGS